MVRRRGQTSQEPRDPKIDLDLQVEGETEVVGKGGRAY